MSLEPSDIEVLYQRLERPLFNVVYRWVWDVDEAADVVQEAFVKLWRIRDRVRPETADSLVYRMAINLASNRRRRRRVFEWVGFEDDVGAGGEEDLERAERTRAVRRAIERLPEKLRRVVTLTELAELSYQEVAEILDIPMGTVGSRRNAALDKLRRTLGPLADEVMG